jgi:multidrug transporter EmrE-like cation transporter
MIVAYVAASAAGLALMKAALAAPTGEAGGAPALVTRALSGRFIAGFALYAAGFGVWMLILARLPLSVAFPLAAGALIVATQGVGAAALGERLGPAHLAGVGLVLAGLVVIFLAGARGAQGAAA